MTQPTPIDDLYSIAQEHDAVVRIERLTHHIERIRIGQDELRSGMQEMRTAIKEMAAAIGRLAVIEERQNQDRSSLERAFDAIENLSKKHDASIERLALSIEKMDERVAALEKYEQLNSQIRVGVLGLIGIIGAALIYAVLRVVGVQS